MYPLERKFVNTARQHMGVLETIWSLGAASVDTHGPTIGALNQIKISADTVQARGVIRAATLCEDIFGRCGASGAAKLRPALVGLKTLISQYSEGLLEIDPEFKDILDGKSKAIVPEKLAHQSLVDAREKATSMLSPLLKFVKNSESQSALQSLMGQNPMAQNSDKPVQAASAVRFDALMRPVTNLCLSEARLDGKNVSVSYVSDFEMLGRQTSRDLQHLLEQVFLHITANSIGSEGAQISLTAQKSGDVIDLALAWSGTQLSQDMEKKTQFAFAVSGLKRRGGTIKLSHAELTDTPNQLQTLQMTFPENAHIFKDQKPAKTSVHFLPVAREGIA